MPRLSRAWAAAAAHGFGNDFGSAFSDIFEGIFGMAGGRRSGGRERGADLRYNMEITLEEAFAGKAAQVHIPTLGDLRGLFGDGRQGRLEAEELRDVRRRWPRPSRARLLPGGAHLSDLSWPRPDDRGSVHLVHGLRPRHARACAVGEHSGGRRGRHAHSSRRRRRGGRARWATGRPLHLPVACAA